MALTQHQLRIVAAIADGAKRHNGIDLGDYPEDVRPMLSKICELWHLRPPSYKKDKGYWIEGARRLEDACGEFGVMILDDLRKDFKEHMQNHKGLAPFTVEGPGSLVKTARAKSAEWRNLCYNRDEGINESSNSAIEAVRRKLDE